MVAADIYRPAAVKQLKVLADSITVEHFFIDGKQPQEICNEAVNYAKKNFIDLVILDTAGRLHVDEELMNELDRVRESLSLQLLESSSLPICEIATSLGYADSSGFIRAFQRWTGSSPAAWRKQNSLRGINSGFYSRP